MRDKQLDLPKVKNILDLKVSAEGALKERKENSLLLKQSLEKKPLFDNNVYLLITWLLVSLVPMRFKKTPKWLNDPKESILIDQLVCLKIWI